MPQRLRSLAVSALRMALCAAWMKTFVAYWSAECVRLASQGIKPPKIGPSPGFQKLQWLRPVYAGEEVTYFVTFSRAVLGIAPGASV